MRIGAVIATVEREHALRVLCSALEEQSHPPTAIAICAPTRAGIPDDIAHLPRVIQRTGVTGASAQRNAAVAALPSDLDAIAFFDDDALPRCDYLEQAAGVLDRNPHVVGLTGHLVCDGALDGREIPMVEMTTALQRSWSQPAVRDEPVRGLYGNNMVVRAEAVHATPFDERLPLYSWLEDLDFSRRLLQRGSLMRTSRAVAAHQGNASGGRTQHRRLGYSQMANVAYLLHKGSITGPEAIWLAGRPLLGSLRGSISGSEKHGRQQRLVGMSMALTDLARCRITPERINRL